MATEIRKCLRWGCWLQCGAIDYGDKVNVVKLKRGPEYFTKDLFCDRGARYIGYLFHPDRKLHPDQTIEIHPDIALEMNINEAEWTIIEI